MKKAYNLVWGPHLGLRPPNLGFSVHLASNHLEAFFEILQGVGANKSTRRFGATLIITDGRPGLDDCGSCEATG